jgi:hypothetical protein
VFGELAAQAKRSVVVAVAHGPDVAAGRPDGMTDRDYQIACDARLPSRSAPVYLQMAGKIVDAEARAEAAKQSLPQLNIGTVMVVQPPSASYPVKQLIDVREVEP